MFKPIIFYICVVLAANVAYCQAKKLYDSAERAYNNASYDLAITLYERYLNLYPRGEEAASATYRIAEVLSYLGKYDKAAKQFVKFADLYPQHTLAPQALMAAAASFEQIGERARAKALYERIINKYPNFAQLPYIKAKLPKHSIPTQPQQLLQQAKEKFNKKDYKTAKNLFSQFLSLFPEALHRDYAAIKIADCDYYLKLYDQAKAAYMKFLQDFPESQYRDYAVYSIGWCYYHTKAYKQAKQQFQQFIQNYPQSNYLASAKEALASTEKLIVDEYVKGKIKDILRGYKTISQLSGLDPDKLSKIYVQFEVLFQEYPDSYYSPHIKVLLGKLSEYIERNREKKSKDLYHVAVGYVKKGNISSAITLLERINSQLSETEYSKLSNLLLMRINKNRGQKFLLVDVGNFHIKGADERLSSYLDLVESYGELAEFDQAYSYIAGAKSEYPQYTTQLYSIENQLKEIEYNHNAKITYNQALEYYQKNDLNNALSYFEKLLRQYNKSPYTTAAQDYVLKINEQINLDAGANLYTEAENLQNKGRYLAALDKYKQLIDKYPWSFWTPYAKYSMAEIYYLKSNHQQAIRLWEEFISKYPMSELSPHALYHLAESYQFINQKEKALRAYERLLEDYSDSVYGGDEFRKLIKTKIEKLSKKKS